MMLKMNALKGIYAGTGNTMGLVQWQRDCEDSLMGMERRVDLVVLLVSNNKKCRRNPW